MLEISGDVAAASAAFAGLVLVFFGASTASFDSYSEDQKNSVRWIYRRRAWPALAALFAALLSCGFSLYAKAASVCWSAVAGVCLLAFVGIAISLSAILAVVEIG